MNRFALVGALGVAASTFVVSDAYLGRETSAVVALHRALALLGRLVVISILSSLLVGLGFMLLIVPGVILLSGLVLSTVVAVLESKPSATAAMGRSWELTMGFRWKVLLTLLVAFLLLLVPSIALGGVEALIGAQGGVALLLLVRACGSDPDQTVATTDRPTSPEATAPTSVEVSEQDYLGRPVAAVRTELEGLGLTVEVQRTAGGGPVGTVKGVAPTGTVEAGSLVTLDVVAAAPDQTPAADPDGGKGKGQGTDKGKGNHKRKGDE